MINRTFLKLNCVLQRTLSVLLLLQVKVLNSLGAHLLDRVSRHQHSYHRDRARLLRHSQSILNSSCSDPRRDERLNKAYRVWSGAFYHSVPGPVRNDWRPSRLSSAHSYDPWYRAGLRRPAISGDSSIPELHLDEQDLESLQEALLLKPRRQLRSTRSCLHHKPKHPDDPSVSTS